MTIAWGTHLKDACSTDDRYDSSSAGPLLEESTPIPDFSESRASRGTHWTTKKRKLASILINVRGGESLEVSDETGNNSDSGRVLPEVAIRGWGELKDMVATESCRDTNVSVSLPSLLGPPEAKNRGLNLADSKTQAQHTTRQLLSTSQEHHLWRSLKRLKSAVPNCNDEAEVEDVLENTIKYLNKLEALSKLYRLQ